MHQILRQPALWISLVALFFSATGGAVAALVVTGKDIKDGTVTGRDLRDGSVQRADLASGVLQVTQSAGGGGVTGPQGPRGDVGPAGPQGPRGDTGSQGVAGPAGSAGAPGAAGVQGAAGPKGETGSAGPAGAGAKGDTGAAGPIGPKGDVGTVGTPGAKGDTGPKGETGAAGAPGPKGEKGEAGAMGPAGPATITPLPSGTMLYAAGTGGYENEWNAMFKQNFDRALTGSFVSELTIPASTQLAVSGQSGCGGSAAAPAPSAGYLCLYYTVLTGENPRQVKFGTPRGVSGRWISVGFEILAPVAPVGVGDYSSTWRRGTADWVMAYKAP